MSDKLEQAVEAIISKTENEMLDWRRVDKKDYDANPFYKQYIQNNQMWLDGINNYVAEYNNGYIYFTNQVEEGYREIAIQPKSNADITVLSTGRNTKLKNLEEVIKDRLDNPDDFIDSLFE